MESMAGIILAVAGFVVNIVGLAIGFGIVIQRSKSNEAAITRIEGSLQSFDDRSRERGEYISQRIDEHITHHLERELRIGT